MIFRASDWSEMFGVSSRHIRRLIQEAVLPKCTGNIPQSLALETIKAFLDYKAVDPRDQALLEQRARLLRVRADRAELELKQRRSELLRTREAQLIWGAIVENVKRDAKTLPNKWATAVYGKSMPEIKQILEDFVYATLTKWSNPDLREVARFASGIEARKRTSKRKQRFKKGPR